MTSAGLLSVSAGLNDGRLENISVDLQRPLVTQLFFGQIPDAVVKTIPYLYTLCAHAQRAVAQAALAAAADELRRPVDAGELWIEMLHENFWRLLLDWPTALGLPQAREAFVAWRGERQGENCLAETQKLLLVVRELAEKCLEIMVDRSTHGEPEAPSLVPEAWLGYWQGKVDHPPVMLRPASVAAAYRARLAEVERAVVALETRTAYPIDAAGEDGWGVAQTLTARGVLTHAVHVVNEKVLNYRVWAPTDVFFADAGALAGLLAGCRFASREEARLALDQAILALDPCVPYEVELHHA
ncbi:MAG: hypothetical protein Q8S26_06870 [Azonexus sp.]|nr:hypothetical protein [Azonexus sp.]